MLSRTIMVVDDSATMRSLISSYLKEMGDYETIEAGSGFEALKLLPTRQIDLILTDINMPDINGLELINFVKSSPMYRHIPLVIVTTEQAEEDRERGLALGAGDYITKPFTLDRLGSAVRKAFESSGTDPR